MTTEDVKQYEMFIQLGVRTDDFSRLSKLRTSDPNKWAISEQTLKIIKNRSVFKLSAMGPWLFVFVPWLPVLIAIAVTGRWPSLFNVIYMAAVLFVSLITSMFGTLMFVKPNSWFMLCVSIGVLIVIIANIVGSVLGVILGVEAYMILYTFVSIPFEFACLQHIAMYMQYCSSVSKLEDMKKVLNIYAVVA